MIIKNWWVRLLVNTLQTFLVFIVTGVGLFCLVLFVWGMVAVLIRMVRPVYLSLGLSDSQVAGSIITGVISGSIVLIFFLVLKGIVGDISKAIKGTRWYKSIRAHIAQTREGPNLLLYWKGIGKDIWKAIWKAINHSFRRKR